MNIHEYQAKEVLKGYGVKIQEGIVADSPEAAHEAAVKLNAQTGTSWYVIKAQIHAGGRGKGEVRQVPEVWCLPRNLKTSKKKQLQSSVVPW
jgi:succinyl-CoA synthetase beta subunit